MSRRKNEVLIEWMDRSCKGEQNRVNVKHILADAEDITVGAVVTARITSRKYTGTVLDLLEWSAPQKAKRKRKPAAKANKQNKSAEKQKVRINARLYNIIYCSYVCILMIIRTNLIEIVFRLVLEDTGGKECLVVSWLTCHHSLI